MKAVSAKIKEKQRFLVENPASESEHSQFSSPDEGLEGSSGHPMVAGFAV